MRRNEGRAIVSLKRKCVNAVGTSGKKQVLENDLTPTPVVFLPDGRPAPAILTADETILLLRLEGNHPERTLKFYRDEGQLTGIRLGRKVRYPLAEVLRFITHKTEESRSVCLVSRRT